MFLPRPEQTSQQQTNQTGAPTTGERSSKPPSAVGDRPTNGSASETVDGGGGSPPPSDPPTIMSDGGPPVDDAPSQTAAGGDGLSSTAKIGIGAGAGAIVLLIAVLAAYRIGSKVQQHQQRDHHHSSLTPPLEPAAGAASLVADGPPSVEGVPIDDFPETTTPAAREKGPPADAVAGSAGDPIMVGAVPLPAQSLAFKDQVRDASPPSPAPARTVELDP